MHLSASLKHHREAAQPARASTQHLRELPFSRGSLWSSDPRGENPDQKEVKEMGKRAIKKTKVPQPSTTSTCGCGCLPASKK
jgi:hypothetical protein